MNDYQVERKILDAQVRKAFDDLVRLGYQYIGTELTSTAALGKYIEALVRNPASGRQLRVIYLPPLASYPDALRVFVEDGQTDSFPVDDFLRNQGAPVEELRALTLSYYHGTLEERIAACLVATKCAVDRHLGSIISGREWIHVPIDWRGFK